MVPRSENPRRGCGRKCQYPHNWELLRNHSSAAARQILTPASYADALPIAKQLSSNIAILAAVVSFHGEPAVTPTAVACYGKGVAFAQRKRMLSAADRPLGR